MDPIREVHAPCKDLKRDSNIKWELGTSDHYIVPSGGPLAGPPQKIFRLEGTAESLACLFMSIIPLYFFQQVAKLTKKYDSKDWVVEKTATDQDRNLKTKNYLSQ